jgi:hypothetical protein
VDELDNETQGLRDLLVEFVRDHATLSELLEIAQLAEPRVTNVIRMHTSETGE